MLPGFMGRPAKLQSWSTNEAIRGISMFGVKKCILVIEA